MHFETDTDLDAVNLSETKEVNMHRYMLNYSLIPLSALMGLSLYLLKLNTIWSLPVVLITLILTSIVVYIDYRIDKEESDAYSKRNSVRRIRWEVF